MKVVDLYIALVLIGGCMAAGAYLYKYQAEQDMRMQRLERRYAALPPSLEQTGDLLEELLKRTPEKATV